MTTAAFQYKTITAYQPLAVFLGSNCVAVVHSDTNFGMVDRFNSVDYGGYYQVYDYDHNITAPELNDPDAIYRTLSGVQGTLITAKPTFKYGFVTKYPAKVVVLDMDSSNAYVKDNLVEINESPAWTNVTSNVAVKIQTAVGLTAYGVNKTGVAGVRFRDGTLADRWVSNLLTPFTNCVFDPSSDVLLTYRPEGEVCFINYVIATTSITEGACHNVIAPYGEMHIKGGSFG